MSLTLDEIRNTRFHMSRRGGYVVLEVDAFVDKIEATVEQLVSERDQLSAHIQALQASGRNVPGVPAAAGTPAAAKPGSDNDEVARLRRELAAAKSGPQQAGGQELEQLRRENAELKRQLAERQGADVQAKVAQAQRLVVTTSAEASPAVVRLVELATQQAEAVTKEADEKAKRTVAEADEKAKATLDSATKKADTTVREAEDKARQATDSAKAEAERVTTAATKDADEMKAETAAKRSEIMGALEKDRDELDYKIEQLRRFEAHYRSSLTAHLENQIASIRDAVMEPADKPELLSEPRVGIAPVASAPDQPGASAAPENAAAAKAGEAAPQGTPTSPRLAALLGDDEKHDATPEA